jgi:hypothetical protein
MRFTDDWPIIREGVWLYSGTVPVSVRVLYSTQIWGSGDDEDEVTIRDDQNLPCYFLAYEMAGKPGDYCNLIPNLESVTAAFACAEQKFPGIEWRTSSTK